MKIIRTGHPAYRVSDREKALEFYRDKLGLKVKFTISYAEMYEAQKKKLEEEGKPTENDAYLEQLKSQGDKIWITYLETGENSFIELFSDEGVTKKYTWPLNEFDHIGYLHLALEVEDIQETYEELKCKDVKIKTAPSLGLENTWQLWVEDPDGNSIEFMQYEEDAWQLVGHCPER